MRPTIPLLVVGLSLATVGGWSGVRAYAAEESKDITRVAIAISGGPVAYTDQFRDNPPAIVIEFRSRNVKAQLEPLVAVNSGLIKEIQSDYYPPGRRALKSLTLTLAQPAAYSIAQQANQIVVNIETPPGLLPGRMAIGGLTILGMEARETLISRLKAMGDALQQAAPPVTAKSAQPKPVVITKPVQIPQPVIQPEPQAPVSRKAHGGFWYGLLFGIGGTAIAVTGWRRRRKPVLIRESSQAGAAGVSGMLQAASVLEHLVLKAIQRQGHTVVGSKAIADLGTLWVVQKDDQRQGLVCLGDGGFLERKVLEPLCEALQQESLRSGTVYALGAFTAPAQAFAKEKEINLIPREEVLKMINVELQGPVVEPEAAALLQKRAELEGELVQVQGRIKALEQEIAGQKKQWEESQWCLGEERTKKGTLEQQVAELTRELAQKNELTAKLSQELDQLKAKSAEVDQRLAAEQEKRAQLETQIGQLEEQLKVQASTIADLPAATHAAQAGKAQLIQESTEAVKETITAVAAEEPKAPLEASQDKERRQWPRLDLSRHKGKGVLVRATSDTDEPINGDARNLSAGGLCVELSSGEALADEFELKLFLPDRTKPIEAIGKRIWKGRGSRRRLEQLGIIFSGVKASDQAAISRFVEERKPEPVTVG